MSTKNVTLKEKVNGALGDTIFPATTTPNVYDPAKSQALSATLVDTPDYEALGYAKFSTASAYTTGDKCYYNNELYKFTADKSAGDWDSTKVEQWSVEQDIEAYDEAIRSLIPSQASADNKLADKAYVNDKVSTDTATFRGTFNLVTDLELTTDATEGQIATALNAAISGEDKNDYAFVQIPTSDATTTEIARIDRYKYNGTVWAFEYSLNNSGFTAEQWAAINSGITSSLVTAFGAKYDKPSSGIPKTDLAEGVQTSLGKADTALQEHIPQDDVPTENSTNNVKSGGVFSTIVSAVTSAIASIKEWANGLFAKIDGYYSQMTVGAAETLVGETVDSEAYLIRPTGGESNEVANAVASVLGMEGNSAKWNQLVDTNTTSVTLINSHSYYTKISGTASIVTGSGNTISVTGGTDTVIDLTLLNAGNFTQPEDVETWLAQHVGTKPYYGYNAGTILSAQTLGIKTYGQNLLNPTTRQARLIPYEWEENSNVYTIKNVPSGATATFTPDATGVAESITITNNEFDITSYGSGILELSAATANTYVCMKWDEQKDDDVVPYEEHTQDFDVRKVYGKVNGAGEYVQCFPGGMNGTTENVNTWRDELTAEQAIVRNRKINLGDLTGWNWWDTYNAVRTTAITDAISHSNTVLTYALMAEYAQQTRFLSDTPNKSFVLNSNSHTANTLGIKDSLITSSDIVDGKIAKLNGIYLVYGLAVPIVYTDLVYRDGGVDRPLSDVLMNIEVNNWSIEEQLLTPYDANGNPTAVPAKISTQYGMDAVEAIDTLQKTCYFADDVKANLQALLTCINTNCSETLGGTFSISETATDKVFAFTFTPNTEPDVEPTNEGE